MRFLYPVFFFLLFICTSCDYFANKSKIENQAIDTIIDFTRVDVSPSFDNCKNLLDDAKTNCFRNEIQKRIAESLKQHHFVTPDSVDGIVLIEVVIDNKGKFKFLKLIASDKIKFQLPKLDSLLQKSIKDLPRISPGVKRGIPVNTQYQLPVRILTEN